MFDINIALFTLSTVDERDRMDRMDKVDKVDKVDGDFCIHTSSAQYSSVI